MPGEEVGATTMQRVSLQELVDVNTVLQYKISTSSPLPLPVYGSHFSTVLVFVQLLFVFGFGFVLVVG